MKKFFKFLKKIPILVLVCAVALTVSNSTLLAAPGRQEGVSRAYFQTNSGQDILVAPIRVNGKVNYCYNAYLATPTGQEYDLIEEAYRESTVLGALFYGYGGVDTTLQTKYGINDDYAEYATAVVITQHAHDLGVPHNYNALKSANVKHGVPQAVLDYARELYTKRISPLQAITLTFNGNTSVQGNYQVSDAIRLSSSIEYNVTVSAGEVIEKTANSFKVRVPLNYTGTVTAIVSPITKDFKGLVWRTGNGVQDLVQINKDDPLPTVATNLNFTAPKGSLELLKIDGENTNKKLQNAVFELLKDNRVIATATSNAEGKVLFNDLLPGDYVVREKTAPTGYRLNTNTLNVTVQPGQTNRQNFSNFKIRGNIEVIKQDGEQHSTKLQGAVFELKQGNTIVATATANAQGVASFTNVEYGSYTIVEKTAPTGYRLNPNTLNVTVSEHQRTYQLAFNNFKIKGNVEVLKVDAEDNNVKLPGVTFALLKNGNEVSTAITDTNGIARFTNVEYGTYEVQEKATLENYVLSTTKYPVNIQQHNQTVNITAQNQKIKGNVEVLKVDAEDNNVKLPGVTFALLKNGNEVATAITDTNGIARFTNVEYGAYEVQEKATLENYVLSTTKYPVNIQNHNQTVNLLIENERIKGNIIIRKNAKHDKNIPLKNVRFVLLKDDVVIQETTTNEKGIANFFNVAFGEYEIKETETQEGYMFENDKTYRVRIDRHLEEVMIEATNEKKPTIKTNAYSENSGVREKAEPKEKLKIYEEVIIIDLIPKEQYRIKIKGIEVKDKTNIIELEEVFVAENQKMNKKYEWEVNAFSIDEGITFMEILERKNEKGEWVNVSTHNLEGTNLDQTILFKKHGTVIIHKIDSTTKQIIERFVKFGIFRDGKLVEEKTSKNGEVVFEKLIENEKYEIKELEAPIGYIRSDEIIQVEITKEKQLFEVKYQNILLPIIKKSIPTNEENVTIYFILVVVSLISGFFIYFRKR